MGSVLPHIRPAAEHDIGAMHRLRMSVRENRLADPAAVQPHHYRSMLREHGRGWIAEENGQIVGFAIVNLRRVSIWALFVHPGFEGRGIGRRLHDVVIECLAFEGAETAWLSTDPGTRAERFYRSAGWTVVGTQKNGELRFEYSLARCRLGSRGSSPA